jgi:hypothetical protein
VIYTVRILIAVAGLALLTGCPPASTSKYFTPRDARVSLERINSNLARLDRPLYGRPAQVSARFRDDSGRRQMFLAQPARILFSAPQCLRFDIEHSLGGKVAEIGSNDELYWLWVEPETNTMWWGTWDALLSGSAKPLIVPPDQLLSALLLQPIPSSLREGPPPVLRGDSFGRALVFYRLDERGWPYVAREIQLRGRDGLPAAITDYDESGTVIMQAVMSNYVPIDGTGSRGPLTPHRYELRWPKQGAELTISIDRMQFFDREVPCDFPERWTGRQVPLDYGGSARMPYRSADRAPAYPPARSLDQQTDLLQPIGEPERRAQTEPEPRQVEPQQAPQPRAEPQPGTEPARPRRSTDSPDPLLRSLRSNQNRSN